MRFGVAIPVTIVYNTGMEITPTYQTQTGTGCTGGDLGNCLVASIATITGIPLEQIPHFVEEYLTVDQVAANHTVASMNDDDWLTVLANAQSWLSDNGFDSAATVAAPSGPELFGTVGVPHLAMVAAKGQEGFVPHIIVVDARGVQVWDPNPTTSVAYQPGDVLALLEVVKKASR